MNKPSNLIIAGAQRSGTTYLVEALRKHPRIEFALPLRPEPKFFLRSDPAQITRDNYLKTHFSHVPEGFTGIYAEKSTSYIESADCAAAIKKVLPEAKIVFVLRNPIDRAISNYKFSAENGFETAALDVALRRDLENKIDDADYSSSVSPFAYVKRGEYIRYIDPFLEMFGPDNIKVVISEHLFADHNQMGEVLDFIGVDSAAKAPAVGGKVNASKSDKPSNLPNETIRLLAAHYAPYNARLVSCFGVEINHWSASWNS